MTHFARSIAIFTLLAPGIVPVVQLQHRLDSLSGMGNDQLRRCRRSHTSFGEGHLQRLLRLLSLLSLSYGLRFWLPGQEPANRMRTEGTTVPSTWDDGHLDTISVSISLLPFMLSILLIPAIPAWHSDEVLQPAIF